jgi:hypothetical protein
MASPTHQLQSKRLGGLLNHQRSHHQWLQQVESPHKNGWRSLANGTGGFSAQFVSIAHPVGKSTQKKKKKIYIFIFMCPNVYLLFGFVLIVYAPGVP